ncbi:MAG: multicopper oxidase family protein [Steroidobacteraceae bacterium]
MLKTRRQFLALARAAGGVAVASSMVSRPSRAFGGQADAATASMRGMEQAAGRQMLNPMTLTRFVDPLPVPALALSEGTRPSPKNRKVQLPYYRVETTEFLASLHRDLAPTRQWGYGGSVPGPTFEVWSGQGILIDWVNKLPRKHFLPVDHTLHGAEADKPEVRTVAHVHGARVPPESDGYPESWHTPGQSRTLYYPNEQDAATLWYHDHAMGITRLNVFAGLFGTYIIRDPAQQALSLPSGVFDVPIVLYDRSLDRDAQLLYPVSATPGAPFVSEFHGNAIVCNGKLFPYFEVQPRPYRLRLLNAANGSFFHLTLSGNRTFHQVGSDLGLLQSPVELRTLVLFPAERGEVIVDFSGLEGQEVQLRNDGEDILQFRVLKSPKSEAATTATEDARAERAHALPAMLRSIERIPESQSVRERILTLSEHDDAAGNSMQMLLNESHWAMPVTEKPLLDSTEIWSFVNLAGDAHPMHLHLVRFQVLDRRPFDLFAYNADKTLVYTGPAEPPAANELGWKDTVRADPGMVTRIIVKFEGYTGRYVWHCHLLEHEDNEMMRPYDVISPASPGHAPKGRTTSNKKQA